MRDQRSRRAPTAKADNRDQAAALAVVIDLYPVQVTVSELIRELGTQKADEFAERDQIERAVDALVAAGLLHRQDYRNRADALLAPTRATILAADLLAGQR